MQQDDVEHVQWVDRANAFDQRTLAVPVQRLQREATSVDLSALAHELLDLSVEVLMPRKRLVAQLRKAALHAESDAGPIEQDRSFETFALQPNRLQHVHQANRALERHRV